MIRKTLAKRALAVMASVPLIVTFLSAQVRIHEKIQIKPLQAIRMQSGASVTHRLRVDVQWDQPWFARLDVHTVRTKE